MRLNQVSKHINGQAGVKLIGNILTKSAFIRKWDECSAFESDGTDFNFETIRGTANLRQLNSDGTFPTMDVLKREVKVTASQTEYVDGFRVDRTRLYDAEKGFNTYDVWLEGMRKSKGLAVGENLENLIFNEDGTNGKMTGLKKRLDGTTRLPGYESTTLYKADEAIRVIDAQKYSKTTSATSLDFADPANADNIAEMFYTIYALVKDAKMLVVANSLFPKVTTLLRKLEMLDKGTTLQFPTDKFQNIDIVRVPDYIIGVEEPDNKATTPNTDTTSMYLLSPEEQRLSIVTNSGLWYDEFNPREKEPKQLEQWGINMQLKIQDNESVLRIRNIKI